MNWFKRKIINWAQAKQQKYGIESQKIELAASEDDSVDIRGLTFRVMPAHGGVIVQMRSYNKKTDRENNITYIIPEGEDVAERVGQIVSMELLRHA